jgi:hypothetical protein
LAVVVIYKNLSDWLTDWLTRLLEQLTTVPERVQNFPEFYETQRFITIFTRPRHLSIFWARWIQFMFSYVIFLKSILLLFFHLCLDLPSGLLPLIY